ncbi:MAG: hypothetical protein ACN6ON_12235 [Sphingobacterium sp.]
MKLHINRFIANTIYRWSIIDHHQLYPLEAITTTLTAPSHPFGAIFDYFNTLITLK